MFDVPAAFSCPHTVYGESLWRGAYLNGSPMVVTMSGDGAVPIWFVPWASVEEQATPDGVLTVGGLEQIEGRLVGHAHRYTETLQPHPDPAFGGGGHPNPKMIVDADGQLENGRRFHLHITWEDDEVKAIRIDLGGSSA